MGDFSISEPRLNTGRCDYNEDPFIRLVGRSLCVDGPAHQVHIGAKYGVDVTKGGNGFDQGVTSATIAVFRSSFSVGESRMPITSKARLRFGISMRSERMTLW